MGATFTIAPQCARFRSFKEEDFVLFGLPRFFTDDTVLTIATAEAFWGGVPERLEAEAREVLEEPLLEILDRFRLRYRT